KKRAPIIEKAMENIKKKYVGRRIELVDQNCDPDRDPELASGNLTRGREERSRSSACSGMNRFSGTGVGGISACRL
ncbi:MAG: hypothetical protein ACP5OS_05850, partial [Leptospirillia bacterium]